MGYPQGNQQYSQYPGQQYPPQQAQPDPWAQNGPPPVGSYDGADPFDNAIPEGRGQRAQLAGPDGRPVVHTDGEPVFVSPPSLRTLGVGTLLFIVPKRIERGVKNNRPGAWKPTFDRLTADVIVCDGQGRRFGGDPTRDLDDPLGPYPVPCVIEDMWIDKDGIIERVPESLIGTGFKIGRIAKVKTASDRTAWNFNSPHEDPEQARAIVQSLRPLWEAYKAGQLPILSLKTLAERYGVKPQATPIQPVYNAQPTQATYNAPPAQFPPMPMQPVSAPVPAAPVADWTLNLPGGLPPQLAMWAPQWGALAPAQREQMLAMAGVTQNAQNATATAPIGTAGGAYAQGPGY